MNRSAWEVAADEPAIDVLRRVLGLQLEVIARLAPRVGRRVDVKGLHDLRVAVRRSRAALSELRKVFAPGDVDRFREDLEWIGSRTGRSRDLDVFAQALPALCQRSAGTPWYGLFSRRVAAERRREHAVVRATLASERCRSFLVDWERFLARQPRLLGNDGASEVLTIAERRLRRAHERLVKAGALSSEAPAAEFHRARIRGKRLRYLLAFFRTLYPEPVTSAWIEALKALQDNLGDLNDAWVQQEEVVRLGGRPGTEGARFSAAMRTFRRRLERRAASLRREYHGVFDRFLEVSRTMPLEPLAKAPECTDSQAAASGAGAGR